jgi:uncharacterized protein (TIGR00299 family) protein
MAHLHIDAVSGLSGDMLLGGLLDLGLPLARLTEGLGRLDLELPAMELRPVDRHGVRASRLFIAEDGAFPPEPAGAAGGHGHHHDHDHAHDHDHDHDHGGQSAGGRKKKGKARGKKGKKRPAAAASGPPHHHAHAPGPARTLPDMLALLEGAALPAAAAERAATVFRRLAEAEAEVHGKRPEEVHFHEVAGVDTIIDVVGVCLLLEALAVTRITCSPVTVGSGTVEVAHGKLPLPAPATAILLRGIPIAQEKTGCEMTTPTGAALAAVLVDAFGPMPPLAIERTGWGAGGRDLPDRANAVRLLLGAPAADAAAADPERDTVLQCTAAIDDMTGESAGYLVESLLAAGALDAYVRHVTMKKGRPGFELVVLCPEAQGEALLDRIFAETPTFGVRLQRLERAVLAREEVQLRLDDQPIRLKFGRRRGELVTVAAEYEDCRAAARALGLPLDAVMRQTEAFARDKAEAFTRQADSIQEEKADR